VQALESCHGGTDLSLAFNLQGGHRTDPYTRRTTMAIYRPPFSRNLFAEFDRLRRELDQAFELSPSIRGLGAGFPTLNIGSTPNSVEIFAFAPGVDPAALDVQIEKGVLTISGERKAPQVPEKATVHLGERFAGRFHRVVSLPDSIDPASVTASYRDGVLHISAQRKDSALPRRINIQ
jgi:HSP20 family protein